MELDQNSLKQSLTNHIKKLNFNCGTDYFLNYIQSLQRKYQTDNVRSHLNFIHNIIDECSREINTIPMDGTPKMRGFNDVPSFVEHMISPYLYNIQDIELLFDL